MVSVKTNIMRRYNRDTLRLCEIPFATAFSALAKTMQAIIDDLSQKEIKYILDNRQQIVDNLFDSLLVCNCEWRVESGEWRVESGEWRVESGEWRVCT
jgi:hypothetical protein